MKRGFRIKWIRAVAVVALLLTAGCSSFELTSSPPAEIYENDELIGRTPYRFNLVSGARSFTLKHMGYVEEDVLVSALAPKRMHFEMEWVGRTRIHSMPSGASVVDAETGEELGVSPCSLFLSRPKQVEISLEGFETVPCDLTPNETYEIELKPEAGFQSAFYRDIYFTSPQGAVEIYDRVAGHSLGTVPVRLNVEAGTALQYRLNGYEPKNILVSRNAPHRIDIVLEPIRRVTLDGPEGTGVYRSGGTEKLGEVPYTVTVREPLLFDLRREGYFERSVSVTPESPARLEVSLKKMPYKTIVTDPPGAEVYRLGGLEKLGEAPYTTMVESERIFELHKNGYEKSVIGLGPESPGTLNVPLTPSLSDDPDAAAIGEIDAAAVESY